MKKNEYFLWIFAFMTLLFLIEFNKRERLNVFENNFVLTEENYEKVDVSATNKEELKEFYQEEITTLQEEYNNKDVIATLEILNTDYKVPVVQANDNDYYLKHLPNREYSIMGSIYADYRINIDTSKKILIYGHNSSTYQMPFDVLENYYDETYLQEHKYVVIKTKNKIKNYELFSIFIETSDFSYMNLNFDDEKYLNHLKSLKDKSFYNIETNIDKDTNILILQTCSTHKDYLKYKKKYLLLVFKEIENIEFD